MAKKSFSEFTKDEKIAFWGESERLLRQCLRSANIRPGVDLEDIQEFIENNEHGLALEWIVAVLKKDGKAISRDLFNQLMKLASRFQYDKAEPASSEADCWQSIQKFSVS
jgi:hypothetical protein